MANTRNNNTPADYCLQQRSYSLGREYIEYPYSYTGKAYNPAIPCLGIMPSHMPRSEFSTNSVQIESALFGINSTNLVAPQPHVKPNLKTLKFVPYFNTIPMIMPNPLVSENNQRPFPIPN